MTLETRSLPVSLPQYSLTGDLLSFARCGLQYRYQNGSKLPPSRPVQMWFGEFIHGVMEGAYRVWSETDPRPAFPWPVNIPDWGDEPNPAWPVHHIGKLGYTVEQVLRVQGKNSRSQNARISAYRRAAAAVNELGPHLFPLVQSAEERIIGTRELPPAGNPRRNDRYELHGVVDVLTNVTLGNAGEGNVIRDAISEACPDLEGDFEVIVDYKGSRRPSTDHQYWEHGEWQLQTYGWLRSRQSDALPVAAGVLIYVNELVPGQEEIVQIKRALNDGSSDVVPEEGSEDWYRITNWQQGNAVPALTSEFRYRRALRVVPISDESITDSLAGFDGLVDQIEGCVAQEVGLGTIDGQWDPSGDAESCATCDFRHYCPRPHDKRGNPQYVPVAPSAP